MARPYKPKRITPRRRKRVEQALQLRLNGASYREIADKLGANVKTVWRDVQDALAETTLDNAEQLKTLTLNQQDLLLMHAMALANNKSLEPDTRLRAQRNALRVLDQRIRLMQLAEIGDTQGREEAASLLEQLVYGTTP